MTTKGEERLGCGLDVRVSLPEPTRTYQNLPEPTRTYQNLWYGIERTTYQYSFIERTTYQYSLIERSTYQYSLIEQHDIARECEFCVDVHLQQFRKHIPLPQICRGVRMSRNRGYNL